MKSTGIALVVLALAAVLTTCGGGSGTSLTTDICTAPSAPSGVAATKIVSASVGNNTNASGICIAYKTITAALAASSASDVVWVAPGTYDAANGEVFPIRVPAGVSLIGDPVNKGAGGTATLIKGHGALTGSMAGWYAALISGATATISGFEFDDTTSTTLSFGIYSDNVSMAVTDNLFLTNLYGGVVFENGANPSVRNNTFQSSSYGVYSMCTGTATIQSNTFTDTSFPIDNAVGNAIVEGNTITRLGNGQVGIQIQHGSPSIQNNTFAASGFTYGALHVQNSASPIVRGNIINAGTGYAVLTEDTSAPDLGTALSSGSNVFSSITGTVISHGSSATINALGNTWPSGPSCGSQIITSGTGTVVWGGGAGDHCP